ncbi:hypothetical protein GCM10027511_16080 [Hymenobacter humi]
MPTNLPRLGTVARALNNNNGRDIQTVLTSLRNLSDRFEGRQQQITDLNRQLATTFDAVNVDRGRSLGDLLQVAPDALRDVRKALIDLQQPLETTTRAVTNIRPGVRDLAGATPDVRGVLRESPPVLDKVPGVSDVGQPALEALTPALRDLRPLIVDIRTGARDARLPLACLADMRSDRFPDKPYGAGRVFTSLAEVTKQGDETGNAARFELVPQGGLLGGVPVRTDLNKVNNVQCPQPDFNDNDHGDSWGGHGSSWGGGNHR